MGRFITGFLAGLAVGLIFSPIIFPDGVVSAIQHWAEGIRSTIPGR